MDTISAVIITKNEARNIERCLRSLLPVADEIVVVDDFSTDETATIAERLGARVLRQAWLGFGPQKNVGNAAARHRYVLSVDADEVLDQTLQQAVLAAKARGLTGAYAVSRLNWYYGKFLRHGFEYPDRKVRLFPRDAAAWDPRAVHEALVLSDGVNASLLGGHLLHFTYRRIAEHVQKADRYTTLGAQDAFAKGKRASPARLILAPAATFVRSYLLKLGFLDGLHGFLLACLHANGTLLKYAKLRELERTAGREPDFPRPERTEGGGEA